MPESLWEQDTRLRDLGHVLGSAGANLTLCAPDGSRLRVGRRPEAARVFFRSRGSLASLRRRDLLALAEAYLGGEIEVEGDFLEVVRITDVLPPDPGWRERLLFAARLLLRDRRRWNRESIAFHYDRPPEFFLPWFERWRSYSHGFYASPHDAPEEAQARKLQYAIEALRLKPGATVFDMGCGWGSFLEFAGRQGIRVHGITISEAQYCFVSRMISEQGLPCTVERVDFLDFRTERPFDGAVFMGTFEHFSDYRYASRFLAEHLADGAGFYADFCTQCDSRQVGAFLARYIFPGPATYVDVPRLLREIARAGFDVQALVEDTRSYACTVRDWADALEGARRELAARFTERDVRAFLVFLRASQYFLEQGRTQAYHLVAGRRSASAESTAATHVSAKASPSRP